MPSAFRDLTYLDLGATRGKSTGDSDEVRVKLVRIFEGAAIEQEIEFEAEDPVFAGTMRMIWTFEPVPEGTRVPGSAAVDAGLVMPNVNDGFRGAAPDLGAIEHGQPMWWWGRDNNL